MIRRASCLLVALLAGSGGALAAAQAAPGAGAKLDYEIRCLLDGAPDRIAIDLRVSGLSPSDRDLAFELPLWGEWIEIDEYYVTRVRGTPPVDHDLLNRFYWRPRLPESWDGRLALHYEIPIVALGSEAQRRRGLLPWRTPDYVHAFSANTLMRLLVGDERQDGRRAIELFAPPGWHVVTGWGGVSEGRQRIALPAVADNTLLAFGRPAARLSGAGGGVEVVQLGRHVDRTAIVLDLAEKLRAACERSLGSPAPGRELLVITEPGMGGTHVEGAITHGHPSVEADGRPDVGTLHFLSHEMFHAWLPGVLKPAALDGGGLEWFFEGFTDYFSLWHLAAIGAITSQQFADHLRFLETIARSSPAHGRLAFADPAVNWRDPDAEMLAYKGGLVLAFHLDVELRERGEPGLPMLFRDLMAENAGRYDLGALRGWCEANGLEESWARFVAAAALPDVADELVRLGCRERRQGDARIVQTAGADLDPFFRFVPPAR